MLKPRRALDLKKFWVLVPVLRMSRVGGCCFILVFDGRAVCAAICKPPVSSSLSVKKGGQRTNGLKYNEFLPAARVGVIDIFAVVFVVLSWDHFLVFNCTYSQTQKLGWPKALEKLEMERVPQEIEKRPYERSAQMPR